MNPKHETLKFPSKPRMQVAWASRPYFSPRIPTRNSQPATRNHQRGFTLIELLVVIGIILVLIGLFFAGAKIVTAQAKTRDTKTALETCKTMFANYVQATHLSRYPTGLSFGPTFTPPTTWYNAQEPAPSGAFTSPPSTSSQLVLDTAIVMNAMESIPENQTIINNLPQSKIVTVLVQVSSGTPPTTVQFNAPLILDGWGNPILFVPGGGLGVSPNALVWLDGVNAGIVTSVGPITNSSTPYTLSNYTPGFSGGVAVPIANQPFFFSAGPDGFVNNYHPSSSNPSDTSSCTDDNIYSFNN